MKFDRRIKNLEGRNTTALIAMYFAKGRTAKINGSDDFLLGLFDHAAKGSSTAKDRREPGFLRRTVKVEEPGDGKILEVQRCFLHGPTETPVCKSTSTAE